MTEPLTTDLRFRRLQDLAAEKGIADAFDELVADRMAEEEGGIPYGPGGHAVVPLALLTERGRPIRLNTVEVERRDGGAYQVAILRRPAGEAPRKEPAWWPRAVLGLRLGLSHRLRAQAVRRLSERRSGGQRLVAQQMVQDTLADVLAEQLEAEVLLDVPEPSGASGAAEASRKIGAADRLLLHLMGASGFEADGIGTVIWISELLADVYVPNVVEGEVSDGDRTGRTA